MDAAFWQTAIVFDSVEQAERNSSQRQPEWRHSVSLFASSVPSRRRTSRLPATRDVWVYWECSGFSDVSHVRDLSTGGIFIETPRRKAKGDLVHLHFLVQEGQISVDGVVAHEEPITGIGLKFETLAAKDIPKLTALLERLRSASRVD